MRIYGVNVNPAFSPKERKHHHNPTNGVARHPASPFPFGGDVNNGVNGVKKV